MKITPMRRKGVTALLLASSLVALNVQADHRERKPRGGGPITLMQLQDVHGHIHPHAEIFPDGRMDPESGGMAKLTTLINQVRAANPDNLLLAVGDTTHGSAETTFTLGDAIMPALNALAIDAFLPGNWDFGYGPRVYRQRFTPTTTLSLAPNNRTTLASIKPACMTSAAYADCHVEKANFPTVALNLYNYDEVNGVLGGHVHPRYLIKEVGGVKVGIIGITSDVVPQQAQAFNTGFRFTMGYKELPQAIADAEADGARFIVVLSELGLAKNIQLVKEFPDIRVMFSGHTHERTPQAIEIRHDDGKLSLVTEAGEDSFLGRLDLWISQGQIASYKWDLMEADSTVAEDPAIAAMVTEARKTFVAGPDFTCHTFGPNAFPLGKGHTLCDPLDTVVGHTDVTIQRFHVLEDIANNAMVDSFLDLAEFVDPSLHDGNTLSTTNGFRFDTVILGSDDGYSGDITIEDLYDYYPIGAAVALAEFTGGRLMDHWEGILNNVFDPNPYRQRGGWFLGFTHNLHFDIELNDDFPRTITQGRIDRVTIDDGTGVRPPTAGDPGNPRKLDRSSVYTLASCYPHGNPVDEVCRTTGARNVRFIQGTQRAGGPVDPWGNRPLDPFGGFAIVNPVNSENIFDPVRNALGGPLFLKVAPDNFVHPVDALRRYLASHAITAATHGLGRVNAVTGVPVSDYDPGIVQPVQGAGPAWLKREFVE